MSLDDCTTVLYYRKQSLEEGVQGSWTSFRLRQAALVVVTVPRTRSVMATQFVKWWKTKFHQHHQHHSHHSENINMLDSSGSGSSGQSQSSSSTSTSTGSEAGDRDRDILSSSSSDILLLASRHCPYKTMSSVLGSDTTTSDGGRHHNHVHSDTEDLVQDDNSSLCQHMGLVNGGMVSSSSESSDFSQHEHDDCCVNAKNVTTSPNLKEEEEDEDVKFEDFECDVHLGGPVEDGHEVAEDANDPGTGADGERKEFSFTFYDLDGHGKITKDDIAGLVRSIYGAVNDSITVPQGGKKTIKVRLTVSPEQGKDGGGDPNKINNNISQHYEDILNTTTVGENEATTHESTEDNRQQPSPVQLNKLRNHANLLKNHHRNSKVRFSASTAGSPAKKKSNLDRFLKHNPSSSPAAANLDCEECLQQLQLSHGAPEALYDYSGGTPMKHRKKWRERLSGCCRSNLPLAKPHLFELLQANMEKNNVSPCCRVDYSKLELQNNYRYQQQQYHSHSQQSSPVHHLCSHNHLLDPKCPILPLLNNNSNAASNNNNINNTHYVNSNNNANVILNRSSNSNSNRKSNSRHHRSKSHDISQNLFNYQLLEEQSTNNNNNNISSSKRTSCTRSNSCKCTNVNSSNNIKTATAATTLTATANYQHHEESVEILTGGCCIQNCNSPRQNAKNTNNLSAAAAAAHHNHQFKHRHREQEHQRAMAQVISWLERENLGVVSSNSSSNDNNGPATSPRNKQQATGRHQPNPKCNEPCPQIVKKLHHHIHEHVHHHYHHHYNVGRSKETPIIV